MLRAIEIKPDVYWVGGIDWNERNFHGYTTQRGSTYNAYLIVDEHVTLIDTCKGPFADEMIERIAGIIDPARIEYVVSNHVEQDHSGAIPRIMQEAPNATIVTSDPWGERGLRAHYGNDYAYLPVKSGDTLSIGKRTLTFTHAMMVHWPDNMATYSDVDRILFSNDAFGQHFASSKHFDDEVGRDEVLQQAKKYYANIVMPYSKHVRRLLDALADTEIDLVAPAHGIIWRSYIADIMAAYETWASLEPDDYAIVVYDSMWHATEAMALQLVEAFIEEGIPARLFDLKVNHVSDIMTEVLSARYIAVGSPSLNNGMMPTVASFLCYLKGLSPRTRIGIPFGSYGWKASGPDEVCKGLEACGFELPFGTLTHQWAENEEGLADLDRKFLQKLREVRGEKPILQDDANVVKG
ncbi:MBL fold metallo-hydrolase [Eggerthellaceae bacterium zg-893]|nr:MBL fold metallo-hydrolase [Eggerthellaceae bacterium zg-893]